MLHVRIVQPASRVLWAYYPSFMDKPSSKHLPHINNPQKFYAFKISYPIIILLLGRQLQLMLSRGLVCPNQITKQSYAYIRISYSYSTYN